jgi:hypothetical protein
VTADDEDAIAELQRQVKAQGELIARLYAHFELGDIDPANAGNESQYPDVTAAIRSGDRLAAIKLYRGYTGVELRVATKAVDDIARSL